MQSRDKSERKYYYTKSSSSVVDGGLESELKRDCWVFFPFEREPKARSFIMLCKPHTRV